MRNIFEHPCFLLNDYSGKDFDLLLEIWDLCATA